MQVTGPAAHDERPLQVADAAAGVAELGIADTEAVKAVGVAVVLARLAVQAYHRPGRA